MDRRRIGDGLKSGGRLRLTGRGTQSYISWYSQPGWTLSGIFNIHSGFPWTPMVSVVGGSLYCGQCGYGSLFPGAYLGGAGGSTSTNAFKTVANSNFSKGGAAYFSTPTYTPFGGTSSGTALPQSPGVHRNSFTLPGYKDLDVTLAKAFGLPKAPVLGCVCVEP